MAPRWWVAIAAAVFLTTVSLTAVAVARPQTFWTPDGADLGSSLERRSREPLAVPEGCKRTGGALWLCPVEDDPGSGLSGQYIVRLDADNCWLAVRDERRRAD